ncbi:AAA family ATPase [Mesorhizobium sp. M0118]|uniref:AAA family ATPase n=1 Tax=Mesorhizobium sp. M0118 TaxID=2956884 RepID=UPI0033369AC0
MLIDEVEAHLHPRWKIHIMKGLRTALPSMTFIVTTHDPLCLRGMRDGEVVVLSKVARQRGSGQIPVMVDSLTQLPKVSALTIEQLLTSDLFSLFSTDDPETDASLARLGDYLAKAESVPDQAVRAAMDAIRRQVVDALPVGMSEAARLVQEAVADYLVNRRNLAGKPREDLRDETKRRILAVLEGI